MEQSPRPSLDVRDQDLINKYLSPIVKTLGHRFAGNDNDALQERTRQLRLEFATAYSSRLAEVPEKQRYDFAIAFEQEMRSTWGDIVHHQNPQHLASFENGYRRLLAVMTVPIAGQTATKADPLVGTSVRNEVSSVLAGTAATTMVSPPTASSERRSDALEFTEREGIRLLVSDFAARVATAVSGPFGSAGKAAAAEAARKNGKAILDLFLKRPANERGKIVPLMQSEVLSVALSQMNAYAASSDFTPEQRRQYDSYLPALLRAMHLGS